MGAGAWGAEETQSTEEEEKVQRETTKEEEKRGSRKYRGNDKQEVFRETRTH